MDKNKDRLLVIIVLIVLFLLLWFVRCSKQDREQYVATDTCAVVLPIDMACDTVENRKPKERTEKSKRQPTVRNYLDEKLSD